jgi:hypothetical protein
VPAVRPVALAVTVVLVLAACQASHPDVTARPASGQAVARILTERSSAVLAGDRAAMVSTIAVDADPAAVGLASTLAGLPLTAWKYRVRAVSAGPGPGELSVRAILDYRLAADPADLPAASALRQLVLTPDAASPGSLLVRSDRPVGAWLPWDVGPVTWRADAGAAVLDLSGHLSGHSAAEDGALLAGATKASAAVTAVWGKAWRRVPVVVATEGPAQLARLTGREPAAVAGLVAVTTADRVYVDVAAWLALSAAGRQVLLTHEVTHLATASASDPRVPLWLEEGFADYVGFTGSAIPVGTAAGALLGPVARGAAVPATLPSDADFAAGGAVTARAYAGGWLACRLIAASAGPRSLVAVYRDTSAGGPDPAADVDAALREVTGRGTSAWTSRWRAYVAATAREGRPGLPAVPALPALSAAAP